MFLVNTHQLLSSRLKVAREQFSGMFSSGELDALPEDTRFLLRGLELFLLEAGEEAFVLENNNRITQRTKL